MQAMLNPAAGLSRLSTSLVAGRSSSLSAGPPLDRHGHTQPVGSWPGSRLRERGTDHTLTPPAGAHRLWPVLEKESTRLSASPSKFPEPEPLPHLGDLLLGQASWWSGQPARFLHHGPTELCWAPAGDSSLQGQQVSRCSVHIPPSSHRRERMAHDLQSLAEKKNVVEMQAVGCGRCVEHAVSRPSARWGTLRSRTQPSS